MGEGLSGVCFGSWPGGVQRHPVSAIGTVVQQALCLLQVWCVSYYRCDVLYITGVMCNLLQACVVLQVWCVTYYKCDV